MRVQVSKDPLKLKLQVWVLGTELRSYARAAYSLICCAVPFQPLLREARAGVFDLCIQGTEVMPCRNAEPSMADYLCIPTCTSIIFKKDLKFLFYVLV